MKQGVKHGTIRGNYNKYTDAEIIEVISKYETIKDLRASDDKGFYTLALRRDLRTHLPVKRTKAMNIVGSSLELKLQRQKERELLLVKRGCLETLGEPKVKKKPGRKPKEKENIDGELTTKSLIMFPMINIDGKNFCGRCHIVDLAVDCYGNKNLCNLCYSRKNYLLSRGKYSNLFNVKDEYVNTIIKHHEKVFEIGLKVDDKTQDYLTRIGYQFIFKENS